MTDKGYHSGIISGIAEFNGEIIEKKQGKKPQNYNLTSSISTSDCQ